MASHGLLESNDPWWQQPILGVHPGKHLLPFWMALCEPSLLEIQGLSFGKAEMRVYVLCPHRQRGSQNEVFKKLYKM